MQPFCFALVLATSCNAQGGSQRGSDAELAGICKVSEAVLNRAVSEVQGGKPGTYRRIGQCTVSIEPNGQLSVKPDVMPKRGQ